MTAERGGSMWKSGLRTRLSSMLIRNRMSLPCPIPFEAVYRSAFPGVSVIQNGCRPGGMLSTTRDMAVANILTCTTMSRTVLFSLEAPAAPRPELPRVFWMRVPWEAQVIAPPLGSPASLYVGPEIRENAQMVDWYDKCAHMDERFDELCFRMYEFARLVDNPMERDAVWPELGRWIRFDEHVPKAEMQAPMARHKLHRLKTLRESFEFLMGKDCKEEIERMLASAVMLPDGKPISWVGDPTREDM